MRLGIYGNYTEKTVEFMVRTGFESIQIPVWQKSYINADIGSAELGEAMKNLEKNDIEVSALGYYPNHMHPDAAQAKDAQEYMFKVIELAGRMGVKVIGTHAGSDPSFSVERNLPRWKELFSRYVEAAEKQNVVIALENCPMYDPSRREVNNIAYSPEIWGELFSLIPSENLGIEIDPSHMVWLGLDYVRAAYEFGHKIVHCHAKDAEVRRYETGYYSIFGRQLPANRRANYSGNWWHPRIPGWGDVDWRKFIAALIEVGYKGNLDIEHEDWIFANAFDKKVTITEEADIVNNMSTEEQGLILGYNMLRPIIPHI